MKSQIKSDFLLKKMLILEKVRYFHWICFIYSIFIVKIMESRWNTTMILIWSDEFSPYVIVKNIQIFFWIMKSYLRLSIKIKGSLYLLLTWTHWILPSNLSLKVRYFLKKRSDKVRNFKNPKSLRTLSVFLEYQ